ncbi:MAG: hypothetical protein C5B52_17350 [Bacteroidetes bacterium]|nr:MAG: hypothetical protein C5B52_17350 [Bacteroidota bacterium]
MSTNFAIALMVYGETNSGRDPLSEEKYKDLAAAFISAGFLTKGVIYNDELGESLYAELLDFDAILVWVNPIEQGRNRKKLDSLLTKLAETGCIVSAHPETILKIGTKEVLFKTKSMGWAGEVDLYASFEDFENRFPASLKKYGSTVLKQYRGNGGNGVFKIINNKSGSGVRVFHAKNPSDSKDISWNKFFEEFRVYFNDGGSLIQQEWNNNYKNGMVRCYLSGNKVAGFGYQEINALYEASSDNGTIHLPPSTRYYFTEDCGLFQDLKMQMENVWIPQLQGSQCVNDEMLPVIWDADFFINNFNSPSAKEKYSLCEINVSSVSPFPPSAISFIVKEVEYRISKGHR